MKTELKSIRARIDALRVQARENYDRRTRKNAEEEPAEIRIELFEEANRIDSELDALHNLT